MTNPTILLVDDQISSLVVFEHMLAPLDLTIIKAETGESALDRLEQEKNVLFALIDVGLPDIDGFDLVKKIHALDGYELMPVILVSGKMFDDQEILKGYEYGAVDYLIKPIYKQLLRYKVEFYVKQAIEFRKLRDANSTLERIKEALLPLKAQADSLSDASADNLKTSINNILSILED